MSEKAVNIVDPYLCPLCGKTNDCPNLGIMDSSCWCNDPDLSFPKELIASLPKELQGKACICRACVLKYQQSK